MVEQLSYELQRVKQRQMDDYLDIDRRLSTAMAALENGGQAAPVDGQPLTPVSGEQPLDSAQSSVVMPEPSDSSAIQQPVSTWEIAASYSQASNLLLKERDLKGAVAALSNILSTTPAAPILPVLPAGRDLPA